MKPVREWKTSTQVVMAASIVMVLVISMAAVGVRGMAALGHDMAVMSGSRVPKMNHAARAVETLRQIATQMRNTLVFADAGEIQAELAALQRNRAALREELRELDAGANADAEVALLKQVAAAREAYEPREAEFVSHMSRGDISAATALMLTEVREAQEKYAGALVALIEYQRYIMASETAQAEAARRERVTLMLALCAAAFLVAVLAVALIVRGIVSQFGSRSYAAQAAAAIAHGDLTLAIERRRGDDAAIVAAMADMREGLVDAVTAIRNSAEAVGSASRQIAAGDGELSARTEQLASSLEETAASMEELASTVKQNAQNAADADALAGSASSRAESGGRQVARLVGTMDEISRSAARIVDIIGVIDGIAFQTNILALNAAVEAARAGEQGRGFAVVATEVRALAHRSADAAREIKGLIDDSVARVAAGTSEAGEAGAAIEALVADVKKVGALMRSIAESSAEQSRGVQQVNQTVTEMDKVVQENAHAVQQSASAAEAMRLQAETLLAAVSRFRLATAAAGPRSAARPMPAMHSPALAAAAVGDAHADWREF